MTQAVVNGTAAESYTYDAVGNRLSSLGVPSYSYNNSNELTSIGKKTFSYDANGNTLTKTAPNGTTMYAWDFENRLTSVTLPKGSVLHYQYDPFGRRIFSDGTGRIFVYDGDNVIEDLDLSGKAVARYTQGLGIDEPLEETASGASSYYEADGLGSITSLTSASGSIANTYNYDSFGNQTASSATVSNRFFFTARENVAKTGLLYYRARYYDPTAGRFLSEDPIRFSGGVDFYPYVSNRPVDLTDPSGLQEDTGVGCAKGGQCTEQTHLPQPIRGFPMGGDLCAGTDTPYFWWAWNCAPNGSNACCLGKRDIASRQCEREGGASGGHINNYFRTSPTDPFYGNCCGRNKRMLPPVKTMP